MCICGWGSELCSSVLFWGGGRLFLPPRGGGTMRSMVEGHARCFPPDLRSAIPPVPLHHLRWSPSPCRGGSAASGRNPSRYVYRGPCIIHLNALALKIV